MVQKWMFGVSYQVAGRFSVRGICPPIKSCSRIFQNPKFGNETIARRPIRSRFSRTALGCRVACKVCDRIT